jgi:hypothetical protein
VEIPRKRDIVKRNRLCMFIQRFIVVKLCMFIQRFIVKHEY